MSTSLLGHGQPGSTIIPPATGQWSDPSITPERQLRPLRRQLQMIYQDPYESLDPRFRVEATVREPLLVHGIGGSQASAGT